MPEFEDEEFLLFASGEADEHGELFVVVGGEEWGLADLAPQLALAVANAGGLDELTAARWKFLLNQASPFGEKWTVVLPQLAARRVNSDRGRATALPGGATQGLDFQRSPGPAEHQPGATREPPPWWTPQVAAQFGVNTWGEYLESVVTEGTELAKTAGRATTRADQIAAAFKAAKAVADSLAVPQDKPDGTFGTGIEAKQAAAAEGVEDAAIIRDPNTGRWTWDFPEMDPIARQVFTSEASAAAAAPPGFRPRAINSTQGVIWGFERIPEERAATRRSFQEIIDDFIIAGNVDRAMELHGLRKMIEDDPEMLSLERVTDIAAEFSDNAEEFRELFQLLTREQRTAAAVAPLGLENLQDRFGQVTAARAGLFGDLPPELPEIFPGLGLPGGETDFAAGPTGRQLFPDQPEVALAFDRGATGPSAVELARQRLGLGSDRFRALSAVDLGLLTSRRGFEEPEFVEGELRRKPVFIEDILGVDEVPRDAIEGLTLEMFQEISGISRPGALRTVFGALRKAADLEGDIPTEADIENLLGQRREGALQRTETERVEAEATAEREATERETERRQKREREGRSFTGRRLFQ